MKLSIMTAIAAIAVTSAQPCWAGNDSAQASDAVALSALAVAVTPVVAGVAGYVAVRESGRAIINVVDHTGNFIGELTEDIVDDLVNPSSASVDVPRADAY